MTRYSLQDYLETNFMLISQFGQSLSDIESCLPWERKAYIVQLLNFLKEVKKNG